MSPNAIRCGDIPGTSVDDPASFGRKAYRSPGSILGHACMLPGRQILYPQHVPQFSHGGKFIGNNDSAAS